MLLGTLASDAAAAAVRRPRIHDPQRAAKVAKQRATVKKQRLVRQAKLLRPAKARKAAVRKTKAKAKTKAARRTVARTQVAARQTASGPEAANTAALPILHGFYTAVASPAQALLADIVGSIARYGQRPKELNPFTGELQRVALSPAQEILLGRQVVAELVPTMGLPLSGRPMERYLDGIVQRLVTSSGIDRLTPYRFKVHLVHTDQVNAFAAPGGSLVVTTGILRQMKSEAHIALILAHEIGHVVARHGSQNMAREQLVKELLTSLGIAAGNDVGAQIAVLKGAAEFKSILLSHSREHENQSDALGVRIMARAGYSGLGVEETAAQFIAHDVAHGPSDPATSDHPGGLERTSNLSAVAREVGLTRAGDHGADRFATNVTIPLALGIF
jgi:predicted Zn-dependent protease